MVCGRTNTPRPTPQTCFKRQVAFRKVSLPLVVVMLVNKSQVLPSCVLSRSVVWWACLVNDRAGLPWHRCSGAAFTLFSFLLLFSCACGHARAHVHVLAHVHIRSHVSGCSNVNVEVKTFCLWSHRNRNNKWTTQHHRADDAHTHTRIDTGIHLANNE